MVTPPVALTIAGTDSGGGAGVSADLATFADHGLHGLAVVTAVTAQDTTAVHAIHRVPLETVAAQLDAVLTDLPPAVVKTGLLGSAEVAHLVAGWCAAVPNRPLVVDPVLRSTTGTAFADPAIVSAYLNDLLPVATVVTPNAAEARVLLGLPDDDPTPTRDLAVALAHHLGGPTVIVTGGPVVGGAHALGEPAELVGGALRACTTEAALSGATCTSTKEAGSPSAFTPQPAVPQPAATPPTPATCIDWLARPGAEPLPIEHPAIATTNDHGTGCTYASALAARLARGADLTTAARDAAAYTTRQLTTSQHWRLGRGRGPIAHTTTHTEEKA